MPVIRGAAMHAIVVIASMYDRPRLVKSPRVQSGDDRDSFRLRQNRFLASSMLEDEGGG